THARAAVARHGARPLAAVGRRALARAQGRAAALEMDAKNTPPISPNTTVARRPSSQTRTDPVGAAVKRLTKACEKRGRGKGIQQASTARTERQVSRQARSPLRRAESWRRPVVIGHSPPG